MKKIIILLAVCFGATSFASTYKCSGTADYKGHKNVKININIDEVTIVAPTTGKTDFLLISGEFFHTPKQRVSIHDGKVNYILTGQRDTHVKFSKAKLYQVHKDKVGDIKTLEFDSLDQGTDYLEVNLSNDKARLLLSGAYRFAELSCSVH